MNLDTKEFKDWIYNATSRELAYQLALAVERAVFEGENPKPNAGIIPDTRMQTLRHTKVKMMWCPYRRGEYPDAVLVRFPI